MRSSASSSPATMFRDEQESDEENTRDGARPFYCMTLSSTEGEKNGCKSDSREIPTTVN
jgi:hypothetical protein